MATQRQHPPHGQTHTCRAPQPCRTFGHARPHLCTVCVTAVVHARRLLATTVSAAAAEPSQVWARPKRALATVVGRLTATTGSRPRLTPGSMLFVGCINSASCCCCPPLSTKCDLSNRRRDHGGVSPCPYAIGVRSASAVTLLPRRPRHGSVACQVRTRTHRSVPRTQQRVHSAPHTTLALSSPLSDHSLSTLLALHTLRFRGSRS